MIQKSIMMRIPIQEFPIKYTGVDDRNSPYSSYLSILRLVKVDGELRQGRHSGRDPYQPLTTLPTKLKINDLK